MREKPSKFAYFKKITKYYYNTLICIDYIKQKEKTLYI